MNRYSFSSDSRRWWWPSAVVGTAASATVATVLAASLSTALPTPASGGAISARPAATGTGSLDCPPAPDPRYVGVPWVPRVPTGCRSLDKWWNRVDVPRADSTASARSRRRVDCPPAPDPRYVGVPWVPRVPTGCRSLDKWWASSTR